MDYTIISEDQWGDFPNTEQDDTSEQERVEFWSHVYRWGDGCWFWSGSVASRMKHLTGYFHEEPAHVAAYRIEKGPIKKGHTIYQTCRMELCVKPDHLIQVLQSEKAALDTIAWAYGRWKRGIPSYFREHLERTIAYQAKQIETKEAREYLDKRYNRRPKQSALLPYGENGKGS